MLRYLVCLALALLHCTSSAAQEAAPKRTFLGIEYGFLGGGATFGAMGVPLVKPYAELHEWGAMQKSKDSPIDFSKLDRFIKEYQDAGFSEIYLSLKANSRWASRGYPLKNTVPKEEYWPHYEAWLKAVVERYGSLGKKAMPGLKHPVRYFEIGTEFSTFQPEPLADYLEMLKRGSAAIKSVNDKALVLHAAFMPTMVFRNHPQPRDYPAAFAAVDKRIMHKSLADMRAVLDHPEHFDAVNFHALGDPGEIEDTVAWLKYEMAQRKYQRPIVISDTMPTPFIGWGNALAAKGFNLGVMVPPAVEKDRPRLNGYFRKLIDDDKATVAWNHAFVAADMVKKAVIATEQEVVLINTSFTEDLVFFRKLFAAGAGTTAWAGMAETKMNLNDTRTVVGLRPGFHAVKQVQHHLRDYTDLKRIKTADKTIRLYRWTQATAPVWIVWLEPESLFLPDDPTPTAKLRITTGPGNFVIESMIDRQGQTKGERKNASAKDGVLEVTLTPRPIFVVQQDR